MRITYDKLEALYDNVLDAQSYLTAVLGEVDNTPLYNVNFDVYDGLGKVSTLISTLIQAHISSTPVEVETPGQRLDRLAAETGKDRYTIVMEMECEVERSTTMLNGIGDMSTRWNGGCTQCKRYRRLEIYSMDTQLCDECEVEFLVEYYANAEEQS